MVDPELYIQEGIKLIKALMSQGNLPAALKSCEELLKINPYHKKVKKYLEKIEKVIIKKNTQKVDADLDATAHLWKEGRYDELLQIYTRLYQYSPQHARLRKLLIKLNERLSSQQKTQRADFIKKALNAVKGLLKEKRYADIIQACNELKTIDPLNPQADEYSAKAKGKLIEQKLNENEHITASADFQRALEFYETLLGIDPNSQKIKNLAFQAKANLATQKLLAGKIHLNESVARMKELFKNNEYEKVIQACEEIQRLDPKNFSAKIFRKKAKKTIVAETNNAMFKQLKETRAAMKEEYMKNPEGSVKI